MSIFVFYGYENGGIETNRKLLACSGEKLETRKLSRRLHVMYDNNFAEEASLTGRISAPEHGSNFLFVSIPPFSYP